MSSEITDREYSIRLRLFEKLKSAGVKDIQMEVVVDQGRIDLVTEYEIIEIKIANLWKGALGQILSYGKDPSVEKLNKRIHLFGVMRVRKNMIEKTCKSYGVTVTYEDEVEDWCDSDIEEEESLICEYCGKEISTKTNLKIHQTKTKYCLELQKASNPVIEIPCELCRYCGKKYQHKQRREQHEATCITHEILSTEINKLKTHYENIIIPQLKLENDEKNSSLKEEICNLKIQHDENCNLKIQHEKEHEEKISLLKDEICGLKIQHEKEKTEIYRSLLNKDQEFILEQSKRLVEKSGTSTTTNIKAKNITMNALNLSQERLESIKDTYTIKHYERGGIGQADWVIDNVLRDENGTIIYKCTDKNRKNFIYQDEKGNMITDIHAKKLKEAILPVIERKLKEYKKVKCAELAEVSDDESELLEKYSDLYNENKSMGNEFDKRLIEKTYV
ncbi:MAG: hypothetical protein PHG66_04565 [Candidatus Colwellbacteria bacterium]|nr:hypothetical protein [Candidatus Colwellbacteria bacterium]